VKTKRASGRKAKSSSKKSLERYRKGHLFEETVEKYFQGLGYSVRRNVVRTGFSGARHEIDVLIVKGDVVGVVEAKNYGKPIPKEWIIKAHHVARDVGASEVYVVSAKGFTEDAVKTAEILGVKLLDLDKMAQEIRAVRAEEVLEKLHLDPAYGAREAIMLAERFAVKKLFARVEEPVEATLVYTPLYRIDGIHTYEEEEGVLVRKRVTRHREVGFYVSAVNGGLVFYGRGSIEAVSVKPLSDDELELLRVLGRYESAAAEDLIQETGWSRSKLARVLSKLDEKGLLLVREIAYDGTWASEGSRGRRTVRVYSSPFPTIEELEEAGSSLVEPEAAKKGPPRGRSSEPRVDLDHLRRVVEELYDLEVRAVSLLYVPIYRVKMEKKDGSYRFIHLAGWLEQPTLADALVSV